MITKLDGLGWKVERLPKRRALPDDVVARYPGIPKDYLKFIGSNGLVSSPDDKAWLVTGCVFSGSSNTAYAWNEWEKQSLEAAGKDKELAGSIREFWDRHLPILMSVKSGYAYFALDLETRKVVQGEEPIYEEISTFAPSVHELFRLIAEQSPRVQRWV
ncbi:MAG: hypothetical protein ABI175_25100 [Polyangiales bacterium]